MTQIITIDLETYYDHEYSLSKITTEEYIRSPQFEVIGFAYKVNDSPTVWVPKQGVTNTLQAFNWRDSVVVCQNTAFDGAILSWIYKVQPQGWLDIMGMSRALFPHEKSHSLDAQTKRAGIGEKGTEVLNALGKHYKDFSTEELERYGSYCINDVELTYKLFKRYMSMGFPKIELKLIDLTLQMFIHPVLRLDKDLLKTHLTEVVTRKEELLDSLEYKFGGREDVRTMLMSNDKFADALRTLGIEPPTKISKITNKEAYAFAKTDDGFKELIEHPKFEVQILAAARVGNKSTIEETRTTRFIGMADRGNFPIPLRYYGAHSGRWSGQDLVNLQNLPSRGENANKIKKAILPPEGYVIIDCDSAQIEARTLAWLAGQTDLVQAFKDKKDVYKIMASAIYGKKVEEITKEERFVGKTTILGAGYGMGSAKFKTQLKNFGKDIEDSEAKHIIATYRETYKKIPELWKNAEEGLKALMFNNALQIDKQNIINVVPYKGFSLPNGLFIQYPELAKVTEKDKVKWRYMSKGLPVFIYGGKVVENFTQAIARIIVGEQMLRIAKKYKVVLTVHDAIACIAPVSEKDEAVKYVEECMSWRPKWAQDLPLACESGVGFSYGAC
jgi:DNA polymerase I-like protein with 3'-5' exonuclease and polymerase domains